MKLLRITAYADCFVQKLKKIPTPKGVPLSGEIQVARKRWIKALQEKHFLHTESSAELPQRIGWIPNWTKLGSSDVTGEWPMLTYNKKWSPQFFFHWKKSLSNWWLKNTIKDYYTLESIIHCLKILDFTWKGRSQKRFEEMQNMSELPRRSIQGATGVTMAKNKLTQSAPYKHTGFGPLYVKLENQEKKKIWVCLFTWVAV